MSVPSIKTPNRPKPSLVDAYNGYYGTLSEFRIITVKFWKCRSNKYTDISLLCSIFPTHIIASANNGFINEFKINTLEECYTYYNIWVKMEFYMRNWKYCEYYIGDDLVYINEIDCYIRNILKGVKYPQIKQLDFNTELKILRGKWVNEKLLYNIIKSLFPNNTVIYHFRAKWLENLELDIFIKELSIGIEYQGIQHYEVINHWGGEKGLKHRQYNDTRKKILCEKKGVKILYFNHTENLTYNYIEKKITEFLKT